MTNERIISLYKITNLINGKIYIGQTIEPTKRWHQHKRDAADPKVPFHFAIKKYGNHNFEFEVIASCKAWEDANYIETLLVTQYDSFVANGKGYNATLGGMNAPKTEDWKQKMRDWHASLSPEDRKVISDKQSVSFTKYIKENGHIALGTKRTPEQRAAMAIAQQNVTNRFDEAALKKMSESHIGHKASEESKEKVSISLIASWDKRNAIRFATEDIRCKAPGCDVVGKAKYRIINDIRYCKKHGLRMLRNGILDKLPPFKYDQDNPMPEEVRAKCGAANIGRIAHNRIVFTDEQMLSILSDKRSNKKIAKDFGVTEKVIKRIKSQ